MQVCVVCSNKEVSHGYSTDVELKEELRWDSGFDDNAVFVGTGYLFCPKCGLMYKEVG